MRLVVHSSYLLNFSKPVDANEASFSTIIGDLQFADNLEAIGCIIHMGKHLKLSVDDAFDNYIASVNKICEEKNSNSLLILENSAHQGTEIGYSIDHLARIYDGITEENREKIGFCLDTCHAFAAGYFEEKIGLEKVVCIHLNDSKKKCNSCVDRHERLGVGMIGLDGIKYILKYLKEMNFGGIVVLETPYDSYESRLEEVGMMKEVFA
jgi:deoxyribonuclease-4